MARAGPTLSQVATSAELLELWTARGVLNAGDDPRTAFTSAVSGSYHWVTGYDSSAPQGIHLDLFRLTSRLLGLMGFLGLGIAIAKRRLPGLLGGLLLAMLVHTALLAVLLQRFAAHDLWYYQPLRVVFALVLACGLAQFAASLGRRTGVAIVSAVGLDAHVEVVAGSVPGVTATIQGPAGTLELATP